MAHVPFLPQTGSMLGSLSPGWYVIRTSMDSVGVVLHHTTGPINLGAGNGHVTQAIQINRNPNEDFQSVISRRGPDIGRYLQDVGATPQQSLSYITQADIGVGARGKTVGGGFLDFLTNLTTGAPVVPGKQATQVLINPKGQAKASSGKQPISTATGQAPEIGIPDTSNPMLAVPNAIGSSLDFLKWIAVIFHPLNLLRAVEFLTGMAVMFYGVSTLMHGMRRSSMTHRTTITGMVSSLFGKSPIGRAAKRASARRRGRRAGELQAERDVAYRGARQARARQEGAGRRTTPGSGMGGTGQGSSALEETE